MGIQRSFVLSAVLFVNFISVVFGSSHAFVNNVNDGRCQKRGQYLPHPTNQCKYIVCEYEIGSDGYNTGTLYATEMPCAPGTNVPDSSFSSGAAIYGNPCSEVSKKCAAAAPKKTSYGSSSNSGSSYGSMTKQPAPTMMVYKMPSRSTTRSNGYQAPMAMRPSGGYGTSSSSSSNTKFVFHMNEPSNQKMRMLMPRKPTSYGRSMSTNVKPMSSSRTSSSSGYGSQAGKSAQHFQNHFQDSRCTRLGEFLTHPTDRCRYIVCEYAMNNMVGYGKPIGPMYAREMKCAPGTAVPMTRYAEARTGWIVSPCTEHVDGYCPMAVSDSNGGGGGNGGGGSRGGGGGYGGSSSMGAATAYHPLIKPKSSSTSNQYTVYWV